MSRQRLNCVLNFGTNLLLLVWPPTVLIIFINLPPVPVFTAQSQILLVQMKYYFYVLVFLVLSISAIIIYLVKVKCNDNVRIMDLCHRHGRPSSQQQRLGWYKWCQHEGFKLCWSDLAK